MQYLTITAALLSSAVLTTAAPTTSAPLERRACSVAYPRSIGFPLYYDVFQEANGVNSQKNSMSFENIPSGSYGCQLEVNFPIAYPITSSGASTINIISTSGDQESIFGTVTLQSSPAAATKFVINSATCESVMAYRLEIASETLAGRVAFTDTQDAGFTMTYNC